MFLLQYILIGSFNSNFNLLRWNIIAVCILYNTFFRSSVENASCLQLNLSAHFSNGVNTLQEPSEHFCRCIFTEYKNTPVQHKKRAFFTEQKQHVTVAFSFPTEVCVVDCGPHGSCISGVCQCEEGWTGPECEQRDCHPRCIDHGVCREGKCDCHQGWTGEHCTIGEPQWHIHFCTLDRRVQTTQEICLWAALKGQLWSVNVSIFRASRSQHTSGAAYLLQTSTFAWHTSDKYLVIFSVFRSELLCFLQFSFQRLLNPVKIFFFCYSEYWPVTVISSNWEHLLKYCT